MQSHIARYTGSLFAALALLGCTADADSPVAPLLPEQPSLAADQPRSADRCMNVEAEIQGSLGLWVFNGVPVLGGTPGAITLGGIEGRMASMVVAERSHGKSATVHWSLQHVFVVGTEPQSVVVEGLGVLPAIILQDDSFFLTDDRAVCAAGSSPTTCRVNDQMKIVDGAGIFANAGGFLHNHGSIDFTTGAADFHARGRICGDGIGR